MFARPKIVLKLDFCTRNKITRQIIAAEIDNKHRKKKSLLLQLNKNKNKIGFTGRILLNKKINQIFTKERIKWKNTYNRK